MPDPDPDPVDDDGFDEDMEIFKRACVLAGADPGDVPVFDSDGESSEADDLDLLRKIRERFSFTAPVEDYANGSFGHLHGGLASDEDEDDFETLRAIQRRFEQYETDVLGKRQECSHEARSFDTGEQFSNTMLLDKSNGLFDEESQRPLDISPSGLVSISGECLDNELKDFNQLNHFSGGASKFSAKPSNLSNFSQNFLNALKKNRACQKFIRNKMIQIEAKIEENKDMKERIKCLMDFQISCKKRAHSISSHKKDVRVKLISQLKSKSSNKENVRTVADYGPPENPHVSIYKMVVRSFLGSLRKHQWSDLDDENLAKGIKQQYQEMLLVNSMEIESNSDAFSIVAFDDFDIGSEKFRSFLPFVNWERLASMYFTGRSGAECESRWLNSVDPLINRGPWTANEDKHILFIAQNSGIFNWFEIAVRLGTYRTPFQCLMRYQRSLNAQILKKEWTEDEDSRLCAAVATFGEEWQLVASSLGGRTGPQCSNRWRKSLHPDRKRVGRWSIEEDKRLKVAVMLFGAKSWNKIALFIPGRTQSQCRERWVNCLDPSLNLEPWTAEEDSKLKAAIAEFGHCWSKVATFVPPRTDNQCRRRWKVLLPHEVPLLQAEKKMKKAVLISNFVDREKERPLIGPGDFYSLELEGEKSPENKTAKGKRKKTSCNNGPRKKRKVASSDAPQRTRLTCKTKATKPKDNLVAIDDTSLCQGKGSTKKGCKHQRKPLPKRTKRVQLVDNCDSMLHLEAANPGSEGVEPTDFDAIPRFNDVSRSTASQNSREEIPRASACDCLWGDSTLYNHIADEPVEVIETANQVSCVPVNTSQSGDGGPAKRGMRKKVTKELSKSCNKMDKSSEIVQNLYGPGPVVSDDNNGTNSEMRPSLATENFGKLSQFSSFRRLKQQLRGG